MPSSPALASYLPRVLLARLAAPRPLLTPERQRTAGAVLISDVQGFTPLVERYGLRGREGLEELTWTLNRYFTDLVDVVHAADGDVLSIAGDALLCYWPAESDSDADVATATMKATRAGFSVQRLLRGAGGATGSQFDTRIGIGAGEVLLGFVGGRDGRWDLVTGGAAFRSAVVAEHAAKASELALSPEAWELVSSQCTSARSEGAVVIVADPGGVDPSLRRAPDADIDDDVVRPFLPLPVRNQIAEGLEGLQWLAETRRVSIVMAELPALVTGGVGELEDVHSAIRAFQDVVERCEGASRVDIDGKGILLLAAFGVPPRAHEDDAERAAHAATLLAAEFARLSVRTGFGVATGRAFCGAFGSDRRRDYMIRGDVVNLAARLMRPAHGGVCCDSDTVDATRGRMEFEKLTEVAVKGRSAPVQTYRPLARRGAAVTHEGGVIGREAERAVLTEALARLREGTGGVVILEGEAGLGKSRLLEHVVRAATGTGVTMLSAAADAIERTTPNYAWRQAFASMFGLVGVTDPAAGRARIDEHMKWLPALQRLTPLLSDVLPFQLADNDLTEAMLADVRAENSKQLLTSLLRDATRDRPALLAVEDAHWLDSGSWALLLEAVRAIPSLLVVVTTRPVVDPLPPDFARLAAAAGNMRLRLESLSSQEMGALIARTLGVADVPAALVQFIYDRVNGHPFFCEELVRAMRDVGAIRIEDGRCIVGELGSFNLPTTVEDVIVSRLDRLTPAQQLCLKVAAVIGRIFRARLVEDTHPELLARDYVRDNLRELAALDLTALESMEPELAYLFKHVITRDVTYDMMPIAHRQPLHRAVAQWHEDHYSADLSPHFGLLAHHWLRAADQVRGVEFLEKAGRLAARNGAFQEAVQLLSQAVTLMDAGAVPFDATRRALWKLNMGSAAYYLGDMPASREHLSEALAKLDRPVPGSRAAVIGAALKEVGRQVLHRTLPARYFGRRAANKELLDEVVEGYKSLTQVFYLQGAGPEWLLYLTASGLNLGEEAGSSTPLVRVMSNFSMMAYLMGLRSESDHYSARATVLAANEGPSASAFVWHIRALVLAQQAAWDECIAASERAMVLVRETGDSGLESEVWNVRSTVLQCKGDFIGAPVAWMGLREVAERIGSGGMRCWSFLDEIDTRLAQGDTAAAVRALDEALAFPTPDANIGMRLEKLRAVAVTRSRQGGDHVAEALSAADSIIDLLRQTPPIGLYMADHFAAAIEVYLAVLTGDAPVADAKRKALLARTKAACAELTKFGRLFVNVQPRALLLHGMLAAHLGDEKSARRHFRAAESRAAALDMWLDQGRALVQRSVLGGEPPNLVADANVLFTRAGATYYLAKQGEKQVPR